MSDCITCLQAKPLPRCLGLLTLGTATASTAYKVRIKSSMGGVDYLNATSDGAGLLKVDLTDFGLMESTYNFSIKKVSDGSSESLAIDSDDYDCIEVAFEDGTSDVGIIEVK